MLGRMTDPLENKVRDIWPLVLGQGIGLIVLGLAALTLPPLFGLGISLLLGFLLIISGLADAIVTVTAPYRPGLWWSLASDILCVMVGGLLFTWPTGGLVSLSLALASFLVLDGGFALMLALSHRRSRVRKWTWLAVNGVLDILLAALILLIPPDSSAWMPGLVIGADLLFAGATLLAMALDERHLPVTGGTPHRHKHPRKAEAG
jgi:uncharacterized membrane protein HdeD (DUF308 family)